MKRRFFFAFGRILVNHFCFLHIFCKSFLLFWDLAPRPAASAAPHKSNVCVRGIISFHIWRIRYTVCPFYHLDIRWFDSIVLNNLLYCSHVTCTHVQTINSNRHLTKLHRILQYYTRMQIRDRRRARCTLRQRTFVAWHEALLLRPTPTVHLLTQH